MDHGTIKSDLTMETEVTGDSSPSTSPHREGSSYDSSYSKRKTYFRSSKACVSCHNKKIKCDLAQKGAGQPCTNCSSLRRSCVLYVRKKRKPNRQRPVNLMWQLPCGTSAQPERKSKKRSQPQQLPPPPPARVIHSYTSCIKPDYQVEFPRLSAIRLNLDDVLKEEMPMMLRTELLASSAEPFLTEVAEDVINAYQNIGQTRGYGLTSTDVQVLELYGCFNIPDEELCHKFISKYFEKFNTQFPIVDKVAFYRDYQDLKRPPSLLLLNAILCVGAVHCDKFGGPRDERIKIRKVSEVFFKRAKAIFDNSLEADPIALVQSLLCFCIHYENMSTLGKNDAYWTRTAVTVALQYEYHKGGRGKLTGDQRNMVKRLWWLLIVKDRLTSLGFGKPPLINLEDSNVPLLTVNDFKHSGLSSMEIRYTMALVTFGNMVGRVVTEQGKMSRLAASGKSVVPLVKKCDYMLIRWLESLPEELKFKIDDASSHNFHSALLILQYYVLLIAIHEAEIVQSPNEACPSWAISFQAAQLIGIVLDYFESHSMLMDCSLVIHNTLALPSIIMLYQMSNADETVASVSKEIFVKIFSVIENSMFKWPGCYPFLLALGRIYESPSMQKKMIRILVSINDSSYRPKFRDSLLKVSGNYRNDDWVGTAANEMDREIKQLENVVVNLDRLFIDRVFCETGLLVPKHGTTVDRTTQLKQSGLHDSILAFMSSSGYGTSDVGPVSAPNSNLDNMFKLSSIDEVAPSPIISQVNMWLLNKSWRPIFKLDEEGASNVREDNTSQYFPNPFLFNVGGFTVDDIAGYESSGGQAEGSSSGRETNWSPVPTQSLFGSSVAPIIPDSTSGYQSEGKQPEQAVQQYEVTPSWSSFSSEVNITTPTGQQYPTQTVPQQMQAQPFWMIPFASSEQIQALQALQPSPGSQRQLPVQPEQVQQQPQERQPQQFYPQSDYGPDFQVQQGSSKSQNSFATTESYNVQDDRTKMVNNPSE